MSLMKSWDLVKKKWFNFFNKGFLINQLMQLYSLILVIVIMVIMLGLSLFVIRTNSIDAAKRIDNITAETTTSLKSKDRDVITSVVGEIAGTASHYENMYNFLTMDQQDYFEYMINLGEETEVSTYFPYIMRTIFSNYPDVKSIDIVFDEEDNYLHGDKLSVMGKKIPMPYYKPNSDLTLVRSIRDPGSSAIKGAVYITFTEESLTSFFNEKQEDRRSVSQFIFNSHGDVIFSNGQHIPDADLEILYKQIDERAYVTEADLNNRYLVRDTSVKDLTLVTLLDKKEVRWITLLQILPIFLIGFSVMIFLLVFLNKVFKKYSNQMTQIVHVTNQVSQGNLEAQVDTSTMELELEDLAEAINQMVINLNQYIDDIYTLEVKQRDAHMRALQSQINPHFLYNTLEYIRMSAISKQQDELAEVVYAFSALLRNNITQSKTTTLKEELDFCEKYVYLYQMRYPDSIAYHFKVDEGLDKFIIPKFIIQPLIENYFVHGIDYERQDNAISVKAFDKNKFIEIQIIDNGLGMDETRLREVNQKLHDKNDVLQDSIGLVNVYQRIKGFFGENSEMWIESEEDKGVTIVIKIER
ncbi:sensor histidine kinase [Vagococcus fluvialis]|uniref:sensor histidine kinase n=1 Tax=Vagococcus fluvialis TaxID=2738 RepID=UPI003B593344